MLKQVQLADVSNLYTSQSLSAVGKYVHSCVAERMRRHHIPEFVTELKACLDQPDNTTLSTLLHTAVTGMADKVALHLQLIEYIASQARAHASADTPAVVLQKLTALRSTYLSTVSTQLLTCAQDDLQKVLPLVFCF